MAKVIGLFLIFVFSVMMQLSYAEQIASSYMAKAKQLKLLNEPTWQRLMYQEDKAQSEVQFAGFFYHPEGQRQFEAELLSNIEQLFIAMPANQSIRCKFPARSQYLIVTLEIPLQDLPTAECPELEAWLATIQADKTVLVYATDFMGNPSSMFGHTLLRFDPKTSAGLNLVSYAVNYAATVRGEQSWSYALKGLTGQYPGEYSLMPYYRKVKEYGDFESRDLWEYHLNLSPAETQFLLKHVWEMQGVSFPYYFISDNCAYRLLGLIDLLRPELNLKQQFKNSTIPVETLKALDQAGLFDQAEYRPALETQLLAQAKQHGQQLAVAARKLSQLDAQALHAELAAYTALEQAKILEMAYDHLYLQLLGRKVTAEMAQPRLRQILALRSQLTIAKQRPSVATPSHSPVDGHAAALVGVAAAQIQQQTAAELHWRMAYHDLIDAMAGYRMGTQLKFLDTTLQYRANQLKLSQLNILSVNAYPAIHPFKTPLSWGFDLAWQQEAQQKGEFSTLDQHGVLNLNAQAGYSLADANAQHLCFAQLQSHLQAGRELKDGWRFGFGPKIGCQNRWSEQLNSVLQVQLPFWQDQSQFLFRTQFDVNYQFNSQQAFRLGYQYEQQKQRYWQGMRLAYLWYY